MENPFLSDEERAIVKKMRRASTDFYLAACNAGCHAFIEFTGLMNEFIKLCEGSPGFEHLNAHGSEHLAFESYHIKYVVEKLECIYGDALFDAMVTVAKQKQAQKRREQKRVEVLRGIR